MLDRLDKNRRKIRGLLNEINNYLEVRYIKLNSFITDLKALTGEDTT